MSETSVVFFPHGPPFTDEGQTTCESAIRGICEGVESKIEGPYVDYDAMRAAARQLVDRASPAYRGIIVCTSLDDLMLEVIKVRRMLVGHLLQIDRMLWIVFVDVLRHPFFVASATSLGELDATLNEAPIWTSKEGQKYLVVTPKTDPDLARQRARLILPTGFVRSTGVIKRPSTQEMAAAERRSSKSSATFVAVSAPPPSSDPLFKKS